MEWNWNMATMTMVLIILICIFGLIGNTLCALVIFHTFLNSPFYQLLLGLVFSDSLLLIMSILRTLHQLTLLNLYNSSKYLEIIFFLLDWISTAGNKYYTVAVSLERYYIICHPIRANRFVTPENGRAFSFSVFGFVVLLSIFSFTYQNCLDANSFPVYTAIVLHLIPFVLVFVLNVLLYLGLRKFQRHKKNLTEGEKREVSVTRMIIMVVVVFGFCHSFEFIRRIMEYNGYFDFAKYTWYDYVINCLAGIFFVTNSAVNFIIYCLMGETFFRDFLCMAAGALRRAKNC